MESRHETDSDCNRKLMRKTQLKVNKEKTKLKKKEKYKKEQININFKYM